MLRMQVLVNWFEELKRARARRSEHMILTYDVIRREIEAGRVVIDPLEADQVGPASIDLHLGDEIRVMEEGTWPVIWDLDEAADYRTVTQVRPLTGAVHFTAGGNDPRHHPRANPPPARRVRLARGAQSLCPPGAHDPRDVGVRCTWSRQSSGVGDGQRVGPDAAHPRRRAAPPDCAPALRGQRRLPGTLRAPGQAVAACLASLNSAANSFLVRSRPMINISISRSLPHPGSLPGWITTSTTSTFPF